jgi:hypothetical protein
MVNYSLNKLITWHFCSMSAILAWIVLFLAQEVHIGLKKGQFTPKPALIFFLGAKSTSIRDCVGWSVGRSVRPPRCAITWKTSYFAIASRKGGGRGNWLRRDSITSRLHYVAIPSHLGIRRSPCFTLQNIFCNKKTFFAKQSPCWSQDGY